METVWQDLRYAVRSLRRRLGFALTVILTLALGIGASAQAQNAEIAPYLQQHGYELKLTDGRLDGPAARWLREEASQVQFLFLGEEHDAHEIPLIAGALWREIAPLGYRYVAIEAGQWLGGRLDRFARFKDQSALAQFKTATWPRRPNISVPPSSAEDITFYEGLGQAMRFPLPLIWGLDHEFKVAPLLARLLELTPGEATRYQIAAVLAQVTAAERSGKYNMQPFKREIEALAGSIPARPGSEAAQLQDELRRRVFGNQFDQERGGVFRQLFLRNYHAAQAAGEKHPRVLLRFGAYHAKRGLMSEFGTSTLANFVAELASTENARMLNLIFIACSPDSTEDWRAPKSHPRPCSPRERAWLQPFKEAALHNWTLFDLRELRQELRAGRLNVNWELREIIFGFDAVVVLKDSQPAQFPK